MIRLSDLIKGEDSPLKDSPLNSDKKIKKKKEEISFKDAGVLNEEEQQRTLEEKKREKEDDNRLYQEAYDFVSDIFSKCKQGMTFTLEKELVLLPKMIESIRKSDDLFLKTVSKEGIPENMISHSANVCIYAIRLGMGLKYSDDELEKLGLASFLHDIGVTRLPENLLAKPNKLDQHEEETMKKHPEYGYDLILKLLGQEYLWLAEIVLQEHEREGGQGYPKGLKGDQIQEYAKIIGILDIYEALTHNRPHRQKILPYNAVREIIETHKHEFSPKITKALLSELSIFPLNSLVKLNSNEIGRVIETNKVQPLRPVIKIIYNTKGKEISEEKIVDLIKSPFLYITKSIDESQAKD